MQPDSNDFRTVRQRRDRQVVCRVSAKRFQAGQVPRMLIGNVQTAVVARAQFRAHRRSETSNLQCPTEAGSLHTIRLTIKLNVIAHKPVKLMFTSVCCSPNL